MKTTVLSFFRTSAWITCLTLSSNTGYELNKSKNLKSINGLLLLIIFVEVIGALIVSQLVLGCQGLRNAILSSFFKYTFYWIKLFAEFYLKLL